MAQLSCSALVYDDSRLRPLARGHPLKGPAISSPVPFTRDFASVDGMHHLGCSGNPIGCRSVFCSASASTKGLVSPHSPTKSFRVRFGRKEARTLSEIPFAASRQFLGSGSFRRSPQRLRILPRLRVRSRSSRERIRGAREPQREVASSHVDLLRCHPLFARAGAA